MLSTFDVAKTGTLSKIFLFVKKTHPKARLTVHLHVFRDKNYVVRRSARLVCLIKKIDFPSDFNVVRKFFVKMEVVSFKSFAIMKEKLLIFCKEHAMQ